MCCCSCLFNITQQELSGECGLATWSVCVALILEEIAIDSHHADTEARLLDEAQELHLSSLLLAMRAFGENNVQTAKHYGNLGRLYQSMHKFDVSCLCVDSVAHSTVYTLTVYE